VLESSEIKTPWIATFLEGTCEFQLEKETLSVKSKVMYAKKLSEIITCTAIHLITEDIFEDQDLQQKTMGWALKVKKKKTVFNSRQKAFMVEKFKIGKRTGSKVDAYTASEDMRSRVYGFSKQELLTAQQISSFFSRLSQQERKSDALDLQAASDEARKTKLKNEILIDT
jgi:hypothetical protein